MKLILILAAATFALPPCIGYTINAVPDCVDPNGKVIRADTVDVMHARAAQVGTVRIDTVRSIVHIYDTVTTTQKIQVRAPRNSDKNGNITFMDPEVVAHMDEDSRAALSPAERNFYDCHYKSKKYGGDVKKCAQWIRIIRSEAISNYWRDHPEELREYFDRSRYGPRK